MGFEFYDPQPGDFLKETLVTDTVIWEVTSRTAKTVTLRKTKQVEGVKNNPFPMAVEFAVESNPKAETITRRIRKDGSLRIYDWSRPLWKSVPKQFAEGSYHYEYVDYSF